LADNGAASRPSPAFDGEPMKMPSAMNAMTFLRGFFLALLLTAAASGTSVLAEETPLKFGIMPFNSTLALIKTHQPLRQALERHLGRPIEVYTEADYTSFVRESLAGRYDILITGPHFAVMSIDKG